MERFLDREEEECTEPHNPISTEGAGDSGQVLARLELPEPKLLEDIDLPLEKLSTKKGTVRYTSCISPGSEDMNWYSG